MAVNISKYVMILFTVGCILISCIAIPIFVGVVTCELSYKIGFDFCPKDWNLVWVSFLLGFVLIAIVYIIGISILFCLTCIVLYISDYKQNRLLKIDKNYGEL